MQRDFIAKGRSLGGTSDLTLLAPIKKGFVESLESCTYKTRIKTVLETLHNARALAHEFSLGRLLSDSIERVGSIQSVRVAVLEPENKVLLAVSFDGPWEAYIRVLWDKVGTLLDLIFCGTEDYVLSTGSFEAWKGWAQRVQVETGFFYGPPDATARDVLYHRRVERMEMRGAGGALHQVRAVLPTAEQAADRVLANAAAGANDDPDYPTRGKTQFATVQYELVKAGLQSLAGLYRLADLHRPGTPDGEVLKRAAADLLREFVILWAGGQLDHEMRRMRATRFRRPIDWLFPHGKARVVSRPRPPKPSSLPSPLVPVLLDDVQAGIVQSTGPVSHGVVLFIACDDRNAAAVLLQWLEQRLTAAGDAIANVAFTPAGLRACGMSDDVLELFPDDFRQGMAARAGLLGDVRANHPMRWRWPRAGVDEPVADTPAVAHIPPDAVHVVLQFRCKAREGTPADVSLTSPDHPLHQAWQSALTLHPGVKVLSAQPMVRRAAPETPALSIDAFGFVDGISQPEIEPSGTGKPSNRIHLGEVLCGHANAADFAPDMSAPSLDERSRARLSWLRNGSFLVMRKMRQFPGRLHEAVVETAEAIAKAFECAPEAYIDVVYAKLLGRDRRGVALIANALGNDFDYSKDPLGERCPLHAHVRLANPRLQPGDMARPPRLMRRGMSYGAPPEKDDATDAQERGVIFMAYVASLSEQFEVVQRWLTGGNGTGKSSGHVCPIVGVPENGLAQHFRFELPDPRSTKDKPLSPQVFTVTLAPHRPLLQETYGVTRLEWGLYLFAPSRTAIRRLAKLALGAAACPMHAQVPWSVADGRRTIATLRQTEQRDGAEAALSAWKAVIEDPDSINRMRAAALWAAIREDHGGVLRTPYGVLVADRASIHHVLSDHGGRYSICGQGRRMAESFGENIYLGMDAGKTYALESRPVNDAIAALASSPEARHAVFALARDRARARFDAIRTQAARQALGSSQSRYETTIDARELIDAVLEGLCEAWFGIDDGPFLKAGPTDWNWREGSPPLYPGHFTALSRYMFQPNPGAMPGELSRRFGHGLIEGMSAFVKAHLDAGTVPDGPIAAAIFEHPALGRDPEWVTRTMVGVMMGFVAPLIGCLVNVLREWGRDGRFWALRARLNGRTDRDSAEAELMPALVEALRMRPMPQLVWRTALADDRLGLIGPDRVDVKPGDILVLSLVSGTHQTLEDGVDDGFLMFGGDRFGPSAPTHACPGRVTAMDAMIGTLTAMLTRRETMSPNGPMSWRVEGSLALPRVFAGPLWSPTGAGPVLWGSGGGDYDIADRPKQPDDGEGLVMVIGDSWVNGPYFTDLCKWLKKFGWTLDETFCDWETYGKVARIKSELRTIREYFRDEVLSSKSPPLSAIVLSAGGNDSTDSEFRKILLRNDKDPVTPPVDSAQLSKHLQRLRGHYEVIVKALKADMDDAKVSVPIFVHGYDITPLANATLSSWFKDPFEDKKYFDPADRKDQLAALDILIRGFDAEMAAMAGELGFVHHIDLNDTIRGYWSNVLRAWEDDLHPTDEGFYVLACKVHEAIKAAINLP